MIEAMPVSYDVNKAVALLENEKSNLTTWAEDEAYKLGVEKAIGIIKSGGGKE